MEIKIKTSKYMASKNQELECKLIRIPFSFRKTYGMVPGEFINLRGRKDKNITLQVLPSYTEDRVIDPESAYVTPETFELLEIAKTEVSTKEFDYVSNITLGCDPEFFIFNKEKGMIVAASRYLKSRRAQVGCDGDGVLAEIRPRPSQDESILTQNIYKLLMQTSSALTAKTKDPISLLAASAIETRIEIVPFYGITRTVIPRNIKTAGFHVHFGLPRQVLHYHDNMLALRRVIAKILDYYLGILCTIAEGPDYKRRIMNSPYGNPTDFRSGRVTMEYRTPGGALLKHPILTKGMLSVGLLVVEDAISRIKQCTEHFYRPEAMNSETHMRELYPSIPPTDQVRSLICCMDSVPAKELLEPIIADLQEMVGWERRRANIEEFLDCLREDQQFINDIEFNWRSHYAKQQRQMDLFQASV